MNRLLGIGGILALLGYLTLLVLPVSSIPLLDANRQVLAESEADGFCAGVVFVETRGMGNEQGMTECLETSTYSTDIDWRAVQPAFCFGIISKGFPIEHVQCMEIMQGNRLWPTMTGELTDSWNRRFPYPGETLSANVPQASDQSRTGEREENEREGFQRGE